MKELLVEFLQTILSEAKVKAVKVDDDQERVVYFGSQEAAQKAIDAGTHRAYLAQDKNLPTDKQKDDTKLATQRTGVTPDSSQATAQEPAEDSSYKFTSQTIAANKRYLEKINTHIQKYIEKRIPDASERSKKHILSRVTVFTETWNTFLNANTEKERIAAIDVLLKNNFIKTDHKFEKIYITEELPLPYKSLGQKTAAARELNRLCKKYDRKVSPRDSELTNKMNDAAGKLSEALVTNLLTPSTDKSRKIQLLLKEYEKLGGNSVAMVEASENAANVIRSRLESIGNVDMASISAITIGSMGSSQLASKGFTIDKLTDPTDIILSYKTTDGTESQMKISLKYYSDPNDITIKNFGTLEFGKVTFKKPQLDDIVKEFMYGKDEAGEIGKTRVTRNSEEKIAFKQEYIETLGNLFASESQEFIKGFWKNLLGCNSNAELLVMNSETSEAKFEDRDKLCDTSKEITIKYVNNNIELQFSGNENFFLRLYAKTETGKAPKLMATLKQRKQKKDNEDGNEA